LHQFQDHALNATQDNGIGLDNVSDPVTDNLPSDAPLDLGATSRSSDSQRMTSENNVWLDDHSSWMEDILQQNCHFFNLQGDYNGSSMDVGLQGEPQRAYDSPSLAVNVQNLCKASTNRLIAPKVKDNLQHGYNSST
jgi:hypothetical protein